MKKLLFILIGVIFLTGCDLPNPPFGSGLTAIQQEIQDKPYLQLKTTKDKILESKDIDDIRCNKKTLECINNGKIKSYDFISEVKTAENIFFRDGEKYSNTVISNSDGLNTTFHFYLGDHFSKEENGVYLIERGATTTIAAFDEQTKFTLLEKIKNSFIKTILAADYYSSSGDGKIQYTGSSNWATTRDAATGSAVVVNATEDYCGSSEWYAPSPQYGIKRGFFPFDTSAIPAGSTITAAALKFWTVTVSDQDNDGYDYIVVVQTSQASETSLTTADYDAFSFTEGSNQVELTTLATGQYNTWTLNNLTWVKASGETSNCGVTAGFTCLGLIEGHDAANQAISSADTTANFNYGYLSEQAGTSNDPYLSVTVLSVDTGWEYYDTD